MNQNIVCMRVCARAYISSKFLSEPPVQTLYASHSILVALDYLPPGVEQVVNVV